MALKNRLDALRRQAGVTSGPRDATADPAPGASPRVTDESQHQERGDDLRTRLQRLRGGVVPASGEPAGSPSVDTGVAAGVLRSAPGRRRAAAVPSAAVLADRLGGHAVAEHVVLVETLLPLDTRHGHRPLADALEPLWPLAALTPGTLPSPPAPLPQAGEGIEAPPPLMGKASEAPPPLTGKTSEAPPPLAGEGLGRGSRRRILAIDTETTGLAGGTGTAAFMVGIAATEPGGVRLRQWVLSAFAGEAAMLDALASSLAATDLMVSYNGKTFDLPLLRDRRRLQRGPALPEPPHLDLLHPTRRLFRKAWPDCRLVTSERQLLGLFREDDLPGSEAPRAWRDYLAGAPSDELDGVLRHNALDVLSLLALGPALIRALHEPAACGADPRAAAAIWRRCGERGRALSTLEAARERLDTPGELELAWALREAGRLSEAAAIWERLAASGITEAAERLAKYHEHVRRDWTRALDYARLLDEGPAALQRRRRLKRRLAAGQGRLDL